MNIKNQATDLEENQKLFTSNGIIIYNSEKVSSQLIKIEKGSKEFLETHPTNTNQSINTKIKKKVKFKEIFEDVVYIEKIKSTFPSFKTKNLLLNEDKKEEDEYFNHKNSKEFKNKCTGCCRII